MLSDPEPAVGPALVVMFAWPMIMNHLGRDLRRTSVNSNVWRQVTESVTFTESSSTVVVRGRCPGQPRDGSKQGPTQGLITSWGMIWKHETMPSSVQDAVDLTGAGFCLKWEYISGTCNGDDAVDGAQVCRESSIVCIRSEN